MKYSEKIKTDVVSQFKSGSKATDICAKYGISKSMLRTWIVDQSIILPSGKSDVQVINILKNRLYELQRELEIWDMCKCFKNLSLEDKFQDIENLIPKYGVHAVCKVLNVPRGTYYNRVLRSPEKKQLEIADEKLMPVVKSIFEETKGMIGSAKIRTIMMNRGYTIDLKHLRRLMNEMNLVCTTREKIAHNTEPPRQIYYVNRLKQMFDVDKPNKVWVSDTTYLYLNHEPYFLTVIIDLFSRKVIGYAVVDSIATFPLIEIFKKTYVERGKPAGLMFHSDQGSQFTAYRFKQLLRGYKVKQSFSAPANPRDNAVAESFFRNIKAELIHRTVFKNVKDMKKQIDDYIVFYNGVRPHSKLKNKTPEQFENGYCDMIF